MMQPLIVDHYADNLYAKETRFALGMNLEKHRHDYSHISILASGKVRLLMDPNGGENFTEITEIEGPSLVHVRAGVTHQVFALSDNVVWFCIHSTDLKDPTPPDDVRVVKN